MSIVQVYETTILETDKNLAFNFIIFPSRSLKQEVVDLLNSSVNTTQALVDYLELRDFSYIEQHSIDQLSLDIADILSRETGKDVELCKAFSQYLAYSRIIPFEQSPLTPDALATIAKGGSIALGATIGYVVAGSTPFLLITVPAGIVLCGAAYSFSKWIEENRNEIWKKVFKI